MSTLNDAVIKKGFIGSIKPGDTLELLKGKYQFELMMEQEDQKESKSPYSSTTKVHNTPTHHWSNGLLQSMNDPDMVWYKNDSICIIKDKYPKARFHFLILPKNENLSNLESLNKTHIKLVRLMIDVAKVKVIEHFKRETKDSVEFRCGFHAVPSMAQLHMHVISQDFVSPCLKTKV